MNTILGCRFTWALAAMGTVLSVVVPPPAFALDIAQGVEAHYITFQVAGSGGPLPTSISNSLSVTGFATFGEPTGFVRNALGKITTFSLFSPSSPCVRTYPLGINVEGSVTGFCQAPAIPGHGFVRSPQGTITMFDCPSAGFTAAISINAAGSITGSCSSPQGYQGFVRSPQGKIILFDPPGGSDTNPNSINAVGAIAGTFNVNTEEYGFVRNPNGTFIVFDLPGVVAFPFGGPPVPLSMNIVGEIAGTYADSNNIYHGFVRSRQGTITSFDVPGSIQTNAFSINAVGAIAGWYLDAKNVAHGFVRSRHGKITPFDVPGSTGTTATSINDFGTITGEYSGATGAGGFLRVPLFVTEEFGSWDQGAFGFQK